MDENQKYKPDWTPENAGDEFAVKVVKGVKNTSKKHSNISSSANGKKDHSVDDLVEGVLSNDRVKLAKTITLIESNAPAHFKKAREVLKHLLPKSGNSIRVGISGVPGAGKSTLIETLGLHLIKKGLKIAVLTIDPSSSITKGSILGDKTRMEKLSREPNCFIRPSPSGGTLGGVTRKSRETIIVCEAAGYDVIFVETVGVGQSEITVRSMVDFFLLVMIAGAGDELQGIKRGVIEISDAIVINKADGDNIENANIARQNFSNALHYLKPVTKGWEARAFKCSAVSGEGAPEIWEVIEKFEKLTKSNGEFERRRKEQRFDWVFKMIEDQLMENFLNTPGLKKEMPKIKKQILNGEILPTQAAENLLEKFKRNH